MQPISRRGFIAAASASIGAGLSITRPRLAFPSDDHSALKKATDVVTLGDTGLTCSMLGMGTGTFGGREQRELGTDGFTALVRHGMDRGLNYIDTADTYRIHNYVQLALKGVDRDKYFIQSKVRAKTAEVAEADLARILRELGCRHLDTCLVHCMTESDWTTTMRPVMDVLSKAKEDGKVRAVGVSCHTLDALQAASESDWVDVILARINHVGTKMDDQPDVVSPIIQRMHAKGVGVIGMKIYGEGAFQEYDQRVKSLEYVLGLNAVDAFTIGFRSIEQIDETLDTVETILA
jgi:predicted aldo/keto reductase-like oxidoreductase